jgi:hypothetical protein
MPFLHEVVNVYLALERNDIAEWSLDYNRSLEKRDQISGHCDQEPVFYFPGCFEEPLSRRRHFVTIVECFGYLLPVRGTPEQNIHMSKTNPLY